VNHPNPDKSQPQTQIALASPNINVFVDGMMQSQDTSNLLSQTFYLESSLPLQKYRIAKFESLGLDFYHIAKVIFPEERLCYFKRRLLLKGTSILPRINQSKKSDSPRNVSQYDKKTLSILRTILKTDCSNFNYDISI
jgi:hypothetical protein